MPLKLLFLSALGGRLYSAGGGHDVLLSDLPPASVCLHKPIPHMCIPLSPGPGNVCEKSIEVHCGGKAIVWAADPPCTRQKEGDQWSQRRRGALGKDVDCEP